jgi:hypothetical protein
VGLDRVAFRLQRRDALAGFCYGVGIVRVNGVVVVGVDVRRALAEIACPRPVLDGVSRARAWLRSARRCEWWPTRIGCPSGIMLASAPPDPPDLS